MVIKEIKAVHVRVPLEPPYVYGRSSMGALETVIVRIVTDDGTVGYGESAPLFRSPTGDAGIIAPLTNGLVVRRDLAPGRRKHPIF